MPDPAQRAKVALEGLSVGDALGERFFRPPASTWLFAGGLRKVPDAPWRWTDDTAMALSVVEVLCRRGTIDEDALAAAFARRYLDQPNRGYGAGAHDLLRAIGQGGDWRQVAPAMFGGHGSYGNGAAMRVAPLGAWWAGNLARAKADAIKSAAPTHAHPDGVAGAVAVAVAAAVAWDAKDGREVLDAAGAHTPPGRVKDGLVAATKLGPHATAQQAADGLGNGSAISAQDTVPFAIWCASRWLHDYEEAFWQAASVGGDIDTNCAIVGGIVACKVGLDGIPADWRAAREPIPWPPA